MNTLPTLASVQQQLQQQHTRAETLLDEALARINDPQGEGSRIYTHVMADEARKAAQASDLLRSAGMVRSPLEGIPVSLKDMFDMAGRATRAGSVVLDGAPATHNAAIVQRLVRAGAVVVGTTNMTEFAFSGVGINPHYGTPASSWDRASRRVPGGSSSGAGVSVADRTAVVAIGTDTGGSVRIPAALNGITGFKPTARRVPQEGCFPLSASLDSIGPLAPSVECCAIVDAILAGEDYSAPVAPDLADLTFAIPEQVVLDNLDDKVRADFERALASLQAQGARLRRISIPEFAELASINRKGGLIAAEAWSVHREQLANSANRYDPRVAARMYRGREQSAADYIDLLATRRRWIASVEMRLTGVDALLMPTVAIVAPVIDDIINGSDDQYFATNALMLRNCTFINFLDGCALSIPCHAPGTAPVGLMVAGPAMADKAILAAGLAVEKALAQN